MEPIKMTPSRVSIWDIVRVRFAERPGKHTYRVVVRGASGTPKDVTLEVIQGMITPVEVKIDVKQVLPGSSSIGIGAFGGKSDTITCYFDILFHVGMPVPFP